MDGRGDADREKGSLASGVVDGMREEESAAAKSCGFGRRVARLGDDFSSLSVRRLYAADEACPRLGARRESYLAYLPHLISFSDFRAAARRDGRRGGRRDCQSTAAAPILLGRTLPFAPDRSLEQKLRSVLFQQKFGAGRKAAMSGGSKVEAIEAHIYMAERGAARGAQRG